MSDARDMTTPGAADARDPAVGDLLRTIAVPDHAPSYWEVLDARLAADEPAGGAEPAARDSRRARRTGVGRWWRPALAAAAVAGVLAFVVAGLPGLRSTQPEPATAAEVVARVVAATGDLRTVQGDMVERNALGGDPANGYVETSTRFWLDARGDWAQTDAAKGPAAWGDGVRTLAFDSATARLVEVKAWEAGGTPTYTEWRDAPIGTPDGGVTEALRFRAFARVVDAFRQGKLADASHDGRPVWRLTAARGSGERWPAKADSIELVVDQQTALPVRLALSRDDVVIAEQRVESLVVDEPIDASRFAPAAPAGGAGKSYDAGYRQLPPADIAAGLPFPAYVPATVPDGFVPRGAALARREWRDPEAGAQWEALALPAALFSWRRGFDELSVSTRPYARSVVYEGKGQEPRTVEDPFESTSAWLLMRTQPRRVTLQSGALTGLEANLVVGAWAYPHLWVVVPASVGGEKLVVTVAGDATADELVAVAESLAPLAVSPNP